jgi:Mg/Co/Ni transporter MgtE
MSNAPDRTKIGVRLREDVWEEFREHVRENRGQVREALGNEVEEALLAHMDADKHSELLKELDEIQETQKEILDRMENPD